MRISDWSSCVCSSDLLIVDKGADDWSAFGDPRRTIGPKGRADMEMDIAITQMTKAARARAGKGSFCRLACIDHEGRHPRHRNADIELQRRTQRTLCL